MSTFFFFIRAECQIFFFQTVKKRKKGDVSGFVKERERVRKKRRGGHEKKKNSRGVKMEFYDGSSKQSL